ncbi:MAG: hypothetical protein K2H92_07405, partial [Bacteroidaceae bacterium]|nr:hypothetical protein [Bacteroidaceae bacterium]
MENITIQKLPANQGMRQVIDMIKSKYIAELMDGSNIFCRDVLTRGTNQSIYKNKPYYFSEKQVSDLQRVIISVCTSLMKVRILQEPQSEEEYPLCYGEDMVSKFKVLGKVIKLPYLFTNVLGKTENWQKMHLSGKAQKKYYNRFTDAELDLINDGIRAIALKLCSIQ